MKNTCEHPEKKHAAFGMCHACYQSHRRSVDREWASKEDKDRAAQYKKRLASDPDYLARERERWRANSRKWRDNNLEKHNTLARVRNKARYHTEKGWRSHRNSLLKGKFGITLEQYEAMHKAQNGLCAICGSPESVTRKGKPTRLAVDHCHITNKVRALLCNSCNTMIGKAKDSPAILCSAIAYLERHSESG